MIEIKYNIDFKKALKILNEQSLDKYTNADLADKTAKLALDYITDGKVKPELSQTDILIDDREDTIGRWNAADGTGIVYKSIDQVLNDLKKLGL